MEVRRRLRRNKIINDIRDAETIVKRSEQTIKRIRESQMGEVYVKNQTVKLKSSIEDKNKLIENLKKDLITVSTGGLDEEINKEYEKTKQKVQFLQKENKKMKDTKMKEKNEKKEISKEYWKGIISASKIARSKERDLRYAKKYYNKVIDTLPSYMKNNLKEMPNNKGYIWRGVYFYGDLPEQKGPRVMFEKQRGGVLVIHEYTNREYKRYEKKGKNRKQLVHKSNRRVINTGPSLMDYVKK